MRGTCRVLRMESSLDVTLERWLMDSMVIYPFWMTWTWPSRLFLHCMYTHPFILSDCHCHVDDGAHHTPTRQSNATVE